MLIPPRTGLLAAATLSLGCASLDSRADGQLDPAYGTDGRTIVGFVESDSVQLRALARSPFGARWMFGDDSADRRQLYISRSLADGSPDPAFGPNGSGQLRTALPANLIPQAEAWAVEGALVQADGKPLVFGGLRPVNGETGVFPGLVCRLAVAGNLDPSFGGGCVQLRSFLGAEEACLVADVAETPDGKFVVIGNCAGPAFAARPFITRLLANGSIDFDYGAGAGLVTPLIPQALPIGQHFSALAIRPDGLTLVAAHFATVAGLREDRDAGLLQFDGGGSLDAQFGDGGLSLLGETLDTHEFARDVVLRSDGRALLLAQREVVDLGNGRAGEQLLLMQVQSDGTLDPGFGGGGVVSDDVDWRLGVGSRLASLALDASGRPVVAGRAVAPANSPAQAGTDFWLTLPPTVEPRADSELLITSATATSGLVENVAAGFALPFSVSPGQATVLRIPKELELEGPTDTIVDNGLRVTAEAPITVHSLSGRSVAIEGARILPARLLGTEYRLMSWGIGLGRGSSLAVVASQDDTLVSVTPRVSAGTRLAGVAFQVTLQQGQVYQLQTLQDGDLSGSLISASRPVAVFGNHSCALVPDAATGLCGSMVEQMAPISRWGQEFVSLPTAQRPSGDLVRVYAQQNQTVVSLDGQPAAVVAAGGFYQFSRTVPTRITSSAPVSVARYARSCRADFPVDPCIGDPFMLTLTPVDDWQSRYSVVAPDRTAIGPYRHSLEIVVPSAASQHLRVNGQGLPPASFTAVPGTSLVYAQVITSHGEQSVTAPVPIAVNAYGFLQDASEGYAFPAAAAASGGDADADDVLVRYTPGGQRDAAFGSAGVVMLDHRSAYGATLPSFDSGLRALIDVDGILVGSASFNAASGQSLMLAYRLQGGSVFADGFEGD